MSTKIIKEEFEKCWDCDGDGYHVNYHNGNHDRCYTCNGTGKLSIGMKNWINMRSDFEYKIREEEEYTVRQIIINKVKEWENSNPRPSIIY